MKSPLSDERGVLQAVEPNKLGATGQAEKSAIRVEFNSKAHRNLYLLMGLFFVVLLVWTWFTEIDEIAVAPGQIVPMDEAQAIRAAFDSTIKSIEVKSGDSVKQGDLLLRLDAKTYRAELEKYKHELDIAEEELQRHNHALQVISAYLNGPEELPHDLSGVTEVAKVIGEVYEASRKLHRARLDMGSVGVGQSQTVLPEFAALTAQNNSVKEQHKLKQVALLQRRQQFLKDEENLSSRIESLTKQLALQQEAVRQKRASLECTQKQLKAYEKAFKSGASSKTECLDARIRVEDHQKELTASEARERELTGQIESTRHELKEIHSRNTTEIHQLEAGVSNVAASAARIQTQMRTAQRNLEQAVTVYQVALRAARSTLANQRTIIANLSKQVDSLKATIASEEHSFEKGDMRAPVEGTVALLNVQGPGEVVRQGQDLLTIVPTKEKLVAKVYVPNEAIAFLRTNQSVRLEFPAYPYQQFGAIPANVTLIDEFPSQEKEHAHRYKVYLQPQRTWILCRGKKVPLRKGLEVEAQVVFHRHRLLFMLLSPIMKLQYAHFKA